MFGSIEPVVDFQLNERAPFINIEKATDSRYWLVIDRVTAQPGTFKINLTIDYQDTNVVEEKSL